MSGTTPTPVVPPARNAADFSHHRHAGFPKVIVKTRAWLGDGSRHHDASPGTDTSSPQVKSHQGVQTRAREFRESFIETSST